MIKTLLIFIRDKFMIIRFRKRAIVALLLAFNFPTHADEYKFYSAAGIKLPVIELSQIFLLKEPKVLISNDFDTAGAAEKKFIADEKSTCLITTKFRIDKAIREGVLKGDPPISLVDTLAGVAYSGSQNLQINSAEDLKKILLEVRSIAFSDPSKGATVGLHFLSVIKKLGIEKEALQKSLMTDDGVQTMKLVISKKVDLGITQVSEIVQADASTLLGPFPKEFELSSRYALWCRDFKDEGVLKWIELLKSKNGEETFLRHGLRPVKN